ncbi:hypothetical protein GJV85_06705 [Sulfurimonas aquatica]|uniref:YhdP central domain-containing protein n=2 Tax=Sulfurimonas aquatica TaxID=2672570 RepID=A0A975B0E1_9BACT|nr:hypothetical protein GJV85_06705 [Sulfurimonas aquatica]
MQKLYIKWNKRIDISIKTITVTSKNTKANKLEETIDNLEVILTNNTFIDSISIENIYIDDFEASLNYAREQKSQLIVKSNELHINSLFYLTENYLTIELESLVNEAKKIEANGSFYIDINKKNIYSKLNITLNKDSNFHLLSKADLQRFDYKIKNTKISNINPLLNLVDLPQEVKYWVYDAISMSNLSLNSTRGHFLYSNMQDAYKNIYIDATVNKLHYKYNRDLDAIHTQSTKLKFENGIFYIYPMGAHSYGMDLAKSWIKIDFTKKIELLTLKLLFDGKVNKDILKILSTYKIKLPFIQKKGTVKTDLTLEVKLRGVEVDVKGSFFTKRANFDYLGLNLDIEDTFVELDKYDITINKMKASYKDIAKADVKVKYNAKKESGKIDFLLKSLNVDHIQMANKTPLSITYNISPKQDSVYVNKSIWNVKGKNLTIDALLMPFNLKDLKLSIPTVYFEYQDILSGFMAGKVNLDTRVVTLNTDILALNYNGITLTQSNTPLKIKYNKEVEISSKNTIHFNVGSTQYSVDNLLVESKDESFYLKHADIKMGNYIETQIYANYNLNTKKAHLSLNKFVTKDPNTNKIIYSNNKILLSAHIMDDMLKVQSKELNSFFIFQNGEWSLRLNSLDKIAKHSELLKKFHLIDGDILFYKNKDEKSTRFKAQINYPYRLFLTDNKLQKNYSVIGKINKEKLFINIDKKINVKIKEDMKVTLNDVAIYMPELKRLLGDVNNTGSKNKIFNISVNAKNTSLQLSENRKILSDSIDMQYYKNRLSAQLVHGKANAGLNYKDGDFTLYGHNFNDKFMENLFGISKFNSGKFDFSINGKLDNYSGVAYMSGATIKDYKTLNNILAFVNTVPSLITFSIPGYNNNGLFVSQAYTKFHSNNSTLNLTDIYLDSKEIDILGNGVVDLESKSVDIVLNLKTDLGSDLSKVPVVGYILLGEDSISTTLDIKGQLANPKVKSLLAKEIIVAPLNIIKRTLTLPYKLIEGLLPDNNITR